MSEYTDPTGNVLTDSTSQLPVADGLIDAAEEVLQNTIEPSAVASVDEKPVAARKSTAKRKATSKQTGPSPEAMESLVGTVNTLADSVATLAGTVETLTDKVEVSRQIAPKTKAKLQVAAALSEQEEQLSEEQRTSLIKASTTFAIALTQFISIGLVATGTMRSPFDAVAISLLIGGSILFTGASVLAQFKNLETLINKLEYAGLSIAMAAGAGLTIGGIQYFADVPDRASKLIPVGLVLFAVAFIKRSGFRLAREHLVWMAGAGVWVCLFLALGLGQLASSMTEEAPSAPAAEEAEATEAEHATTETTIAEDAHSAEATASSDSHASTEETTTTVATAEHATESSSIEAHH